MPWNGPTGYRVELELERKSAGGEGEPVAVPVVMTGSSAGGIPALVEVLAGLPADFPGAILVVHHLGSGSSRLPEVLQRRTALCVRWASERQRIVPGVVYVCPPRHRFIAHGSGMVTLARMSCSPGDPRNIDASFESIARRYKRTVLGIVFSGVGVDGASGVRAVHRGSGTVLAQSVDSATFGGMPRSALQTGCVDQALPLGAIAPALLRVSAEGHLGAGVTPDRSGVMSLAAVLLPPPLQQSLDDLLHRAVALQGTDMGHLQLVPLGGSALRIVAQRGFGAEFLEHFRSGECGDGSWGSRALATGQSMAVEDVRTDARYVRHRAAAGAARYCAEVSIPLLGVTGAAAGVLSLQFEASRLPTLSQMKVLYAHAREATALIQRHGYGGRP